LVLDSTTSVSKTSSLAAEVTVTEAAALSLSFEAKDPSGVA